MSRVLVWDFDGVLNANVVDGRFIWADGLEADWGMSAAALSDHLFTPPHIGQIIRGQVDLRDVLAAWLAEVHPEIDVDAFLTYWFEKDMFPDPEVIGHLERPGWRHVIGTNNEARRTRYIEQEMGFGTRVERIFASGLMDCAKPDDAYFAQIEAWSGAPSGAHVLIDDTRVNVAAAQARGWHGYHFVDATRGGLGAFLDGLE